MVVRLRVVIALSNLHDALKDPSKVPTRLHHPKYLYLLQLSPIIPKIYYRIFAMVIPNEQAGETHRYSKVNPRSIDTWIAFAALNAWTREWLN